jgi:hypothetical protein
MSNLLDLVDQLIGDILQGNVFTDTNSYVGTVLQRPPGADTHIPNADPRALNFPGPVHPEGVIPDISKPGPTPTAGQEIHSVLGTTNDPRALNFPGPEHPGGVIPELSKPGPTPTAGQEVHSVLGTTNDPRLLNFPEENPHPHSDIAGPGGEQNSKQYTIVDPPRHNQKSDFSGVPPDPGGKDGYIIPGKRGEIYQGNKPPGETRDSIQDQRSAIASNTPLPEQRGGGGAIPNTQANPLIETRPEQIDVGHTPVPRNEREKLYEQANDRNRHGSRIQELLDFHKSVEDDLSFGKTQFDRNQDLRKQIYEGAPKEEQLRSNVAGGASIPTEGDLLAFEKTPPPRPQEDVDRLKADASFAKGQQFDDQRRADIYQKPHEPNPGEFDIKANIGGGPGVGDESIPTSRPTIGDEAAARREPPTRNLLFDRPDQDPEVRPQPLEQPSRDDIYREPNLTLEPLGRPTAGDLESIEGRPPTPPLDTIENGTGRPEFAPIEGQLRNRDPGHRLGNTYDDGPVSLFDRGGPYAAIPGEVSALKYFDIFAITHWLRAIAKDGIPLPVVSSQQNDPITREGKTEITSEAIAKGIQWNVSQLLLASFNSWDPLGHGGLNALWNPLSLILSAIPGVGRTTIAGISPAAITAGAALGFTYKDNVNASVALKTERLVLMRSGGYSEVSPVHRLSKLRSPVAVPGYFGDIAATSDAAVNLEDEKIPSTTAVPIQTQVDGGGDTNLVKTSTGLHTNLYTSEERYTDTARLPLKDLEQAVDDLSPSSQKNLPESIKLQRLFTPRQYPGADGLSAIGILGQLGVGIPSSLATTWTAKFDEQGGGFDTESQKDAPGLVAATTDVQFVEEEKIKSGEFAQQSKGFAKTLIKEGNIYMPFMFQDLRDVEDQFLYFRAFLKPGLAETFTPDWQVERYYGRVDQVPIYMGTLRNLAVSFDVVAWSPADLPVMWRKLQKLQSMVYPFYNKGGFFKAGPIIRMRIGDLFANQANKGIPGYITSMDWSYDDGIWNLKTDFRVPRKVSVSIGFTVLHDGNPGVYPYKANESAPDNIDFAADLNEQPKTTDGFTFGAGKITNKDGNVQIKVDPSEIRKIFERVRNKES